MLILCYASTSSKQQRFHLLLNVGDVTATYTGHITTGIYRLPTEWKTCTLSNIRATSKLFKIDNIASNQPMNTFFLF
jgi:hypothetical protein